MLTGGGSFSHITSRRLAVDMHAIKQPTFGTEILRSFHSLRMTKQRMYNLTMTTVYTFVPSTSHEYPSHPERPGRFELLKARLDSFEAERLAARPATREEIASVHDPKLVAALERVCRE